MMLTVKVDLSMGTKKQERRFIGTSLQVTDTQLNVV